MPCLGYRVDSIEKKGRDAGINGFWYCPSLKHFHERWRHCHLYNSTCYASESTGPFLTRVELSPKRMCTFYAARFLRPGAGYPAFLRTIFPASAAAKAASATDARRVCDTRVTPDRPGYSRSSGLLPIVRVTPDRPGYSSPSGASLGLRDSQSRSVKNHCARSSRLPGSGDQS